MGFASPASVRLSPPFLYNIDFSKFYVAIRPLLVELGLKMAVLFAYTMSRLQLVDIKMNYKISQSSCSSGTQFAIGGYGRNQKGFSRNNKSRGGSAMAEHNGHTQ
jgi:hypothetical protein